MTRGDASDGENQRGGAGRAEKGAYNGRSDGTTRANKARGAHATTGESTEARDEREEADGLSTVGGTEEGQ